MQLQPARNTAQPAAPVRSAALAARVAALKVVEAPPAPRAEEPPAPPAGAPPPPARSSSLKDRIALLQASEGGTANLGKMRPAPARIPQSPSRSTHELVGVKLPGAAGEEGVGGGGLLPGLTPTTKPPLSKRKPPSRKAPPKWVAEDGPGSAA